ncbi:hypothetical protein GGX14DRAFT_504749 [Mycena pura]|uniref:Glycosyltransferase family 15 protein n=1 Tax=Mycena pura TaxID=153505 RepID=A0AAD6Y6H6_9AGAR|nr:hypothetical protein GGX14DRAFT_504749 [Mycena pura]
MSLWSRFCLLLVLCLLTLLFFLSFSTYADTTSVVLHPPSHPVVSANGSTAVGAGHPLPHILLVSAFFPLSKSKHTMGEYEYWLERFLQPITTDIYFYTPPDMESLVRKCRGDRPITIDTTYPSPFAIPPLDGMRERYHEMHALDREQFRHSPELYAVWNAKEFFLDEAVQARSRAGKEYDYAFWNDAGSFRSPHKYVSWPDPQRVQEVWQQGSALTGVKPDELLFFPLTGMPHPRMRYWTQDHGPVDNEFSEGSFFGGSPRTIAWWRRTFYAYHDHYLALGLFVGKDQTVINALFLLFPSRIIGVWLGDPDAPAHVGLLPLVDEGPLGNCGSEWFYYQFWLAAPAEQAASRADWESNSRWQWGWWRQRQECRVTRVVAMQDLLRRRFGPDWNPPLHTVNTE